MLIIYLFIFWTYKIRMILIPKNSDNVLSLGFWCQNWHHLVLSFLFYKFNIKTYNCLKNWASYFLPNKKWHFHFNYKFMKLILCHIYIYPNLISKKEEEHTNWRWLVRLKNLQTCRSRKKTKKKKVKRTFAHVRAERT